MEPEEWGALLGYAIVAMIIYELVVAPLLGLPPNPLAAH
jgi:hypothetical protein